MIRQVVIYNPATGEIDRSANNYDTAKPAKWVSAYLSEHPEFAAALRENGLPLPDADGFKVVSGSVVVKSASDKLALLKHRARKEIIASAREYLDDAFDLGTMVDFIGILVDPDSDASKKSQIRSAFMWRNTVMAEALNRLETVNNATDASQITASMKDFSSFDVTKPPVTLKGLLA